MKEKLAYKDKFLLTILEASQYFNIGQKSLRRMAENHLSDFAVYEGNRYLIIRPPNGSILFERRHPTRETRRTRRNDTK